MNPKTIDLFTIALGLQKPWTCTNMEFDKEAGRLDLWIDFERGSRFECPECGRQQCTVYDTTDKEWRHLNFFQHQCYLHARVPRVKCDECGVHLSSVPWARPGSGFTLLFEAMALAMAEQMPMTEVSKLMEVFDTQLWRLVRHYVEQAREDTTAEYIHRVGVDETASSRGHRYVSVFVDMDTRRVVYATPGRDASTVESFVEDLVAHDGLPGQIESVCCDMSPAFIEGISKSLPEAGITFDRFHVMQLAGAAVDAVRREERKTNAALKRTRYVWLKNPSSLNHREQTLLESLSKQGLKTARAYHLRMSLRALWDQKPEHAHQYLLRWYKWAIRCRLAPMVALARTVRNHWDGILRYIESRLTNGVVEGINSKIQLARTRARGYRSVRNFITMIYLVAGKLQFDLPT